MHPEILTPVEDCWCFTTESRYNSHSKDKGGVANIGGGPAQAPGPAPAAAAAPGLPALARPGPAPAPKSPAPAPAAGSNQGKNQNKDNDHGDNDDGNGPNQTKPKSAAPSAPVGTAPAGPASASATTSSSSSSSYNSDDVNLPFFSFAPDSPLKSILAAPALPPPSWNSDNKVHFNIDCRETKDVCDGMTETLNAAGWYISQVFYISRRSTNVR